MRLVFKKSDVRPFPIETVSNQTYNVDHAVSLVADRK